MTYAQKFYNQSIRAYQLVMNHRHQLAHYGKNVLNLVCFFDDHGLDIADHHHITVGGMLNEYKNKIVNYRHFGKNSVFSYQIVKNMGLTNEKIKVVPVSIKDLHHLFNALVTTQIASYYGTYGDWTDKSSLSINKALHLLSLDWHDGLVLSKGRENELNYSLDRQITEFNVNASLAIAYVNQALKHHNSAKDFNKAKVQADSIAYFAMNADYLPDGNKITRVFYNAVDRCIGMGFAPRLNLSNSDKIKYLKKVYHQAQNDFVSDIRNFSFIEKLDD